MIPVWSLKAALGMVDLVDEETVVAVLVDEHEAREAASSTTHSPTAVRITDRPPNASTTIVLPPRDASLPEL